MEYDEILQQVIEFLGTFAFLTGLAAMSVALLWQLVVVQFAM